MCAHSGFYYFFFFKMVCNSGGGRLTEQDRRKYRRHTADEMKSVRIQSKRRLCRDFFHVDYFSYNPSHYLFPSSPGEREDSLYHLLLAYNGPAAHSQKERKKRRGKRSGKVTTTLKTIITTTTTGFVLVAFFPLFFSLSLSLRSLLFFSYCVSFNRNNLALPCSGNTAKQTDHGIKQKKEDRRGKNT